jgi:hypothetical protein
MNECYCICHVNPEQVFHCGPCCWQCQYCLGNIIDTPEDHYKECWAAKETKMEICDKLESVWKPACEHCHNCECHKPPEGPCPYVKCYCCGETIPSIESSVVSILMIINIFCTYTLSYVAVTRDIKLQKITKKLR